MTRNMRTRKPAAPVAKGAGMGLMFFGLLFLCAALGALYFGMAAPLHGYMDSSDWIEVTARLDHAELRETRSNNSSTWKVVARYRYRYQSIWRVGTRVGLQDFSDNDRAYHEALLRRLREENHKQMLTAWVNPDQPDDALLVREIRTFAMAMMSLLGLVFAGVGVGLIVAGRLRRRDNRRSASNDLIPCNQRSTALFLPL